MQRDPLGYAPGWNLYQYVNGMPWGSVDPMGLWSVKEALYTAWYFVQEYAQLHVDAVNALMHPIQTGEALGDKAVAYENSAAAYEGRTPTQTDYVIALILVS